MFDINMTKQRGDERVAITTMCHLNIGNTKIKCLVDNISETGALVKLTASEQSNIHLDEIGTLDVLLLSPVSYRCKVVWIKSDQIGLQFIDASAD